MRAVSEKEIQGYIIKNKSRKIYNRCLNAYCNKLGIEPERISSEIKILTRIFSEEIAKIENRFNKMPSVHYRDGHDMSPPPDRPGTGMAGSE